MDKMKWEKVKEVLLTYLKQVSLLLEKSENLVNPERRIQGVKVDNKMIQLVYFPLDGQTNPRRRKGYRANGKTTNLKLVGKQC